MKTKTQDNQKASGKPELPNTLESQRDYYKEEAWQNQQTILALRKQRDKYKASAEALAEALRNVLNGPASSVKKGDWPVWDKAMAALAAWEAGQ